MCTNLTLKAVNGDLFFGRTMDLNQSMFGEDPGMDLDVKIISIPKGVKIDSQLEPWDSKYAVLGIGTKDSTLLYDGINECGLTGDCQVLKEATRSSIDDIKAQGKLPIIGEEFLLFVLTKFKSVKEIRESYSNYMFADQKFNYQGNQFQFPLHFTFIDESGDGVVLEPVDKGGFKIYDYVYVATNSPEYNYHTTNIRNYIGLNDVGVTEKKFDNGTIVEPIEGGTGFGLFGIPGDFTSPSRFVRAFYYKNMVDPFDSGKGFNTLYAVFRSLIIPRGLEHDKEGGRMTDYTRYWAAYDISNRTLCTQTGEGLAFTSKVLDESINEISFNDINMDNHTYVV